MWLKWFGLTALTVSSAVSASDVELVGIASVVDGDTLVVNQKRIRLWGIDAPEYAQQRRTRTGNAWPCGRRAANALDELLQGRTMRCLQRDRDRYERSVVECFVHGQSVNAWMVRSGWAVAHREYAMAYVSHEGLAKRDKVNLWQGVFQNPADYRRAKRQTSEARTAQVSSPKSGCAIKGNISRGGRKIYHSPGQRDYARTSIDLKQGERYFCTAEEAQRAGWRAAER